jgi:hypothetical protein
VNSTSFVYLVAFIGLSAIMLIATILKNPRVIRNALKIPTVWLTIIILLGFVLGTGGIDLDYQDLGATTFADSRLLRVATILMVAASSLIILTSFHKLKFMLHGNLLILSIFSLLAFFSTFFSAIPSMTIFKSLELVTVIMVAATVYTTALFWCYFVTAFGIYLQLIIYGTEGLKQIHGITPFLSFMLSSRYPGLAANSVGFLGALVCLFGVYLWYTLNSSGQRRRLLAGTIGIAGFGITFQSYTRSILVFLILAVVLFLALNRKFLPVATIFFAAAITLSFPQSRTSILDHMRRGDSNEKLETLSARTAFWHEILERDMLPLTVGSGYATGTLFINQSNSSFAYGRGLFTPRNAHNSVFELIMGVGILGASIWIFLITRIFYLLIFYYRRLKRSLTNNDLLLYRFIISVYTLSILRTIMNSSFVYLDFFFPLFLALAVYTDTLPAIAKRIYVAPSLQGKRPVTSISPRKT